MRQLIRYGVLGIAINACMYLLYLLITHFGMEPKKAMTLVYAAGAIIGFFGNKKWTFAHRGRFGGAASRYVLAQFAGYTINFVLLFTFVDRLGFVHQWVQAVAILIVAAFLFVVFKLIVFANDRKSV